MPGYDSFCCFRSPHSSAGKRLLWELNTACNLNCGYCHTRNEKKHTGISLEKVKAFYPFLKELGIGDIIFSGGEPFLRPDIFDILISAKEAGFSVDVCSNGTLIDDSMAERLKEILAEISISIDSSVPFIHDRLRGSNTHQEVLAAVNRLVSAGLEVHAVTVVTNESAADMEQTASFLAGAGVHSLTFLGRMSTRRDKSPLPLTIKQAALEETLQKIRQKLSIPINSKRLFFEPTEFGCSAGESMFGIDAGGNLLPCILMKEPGLSKSFGSSGGCGGPPRGQGISRFAAGANKGRFPRQKSVSLNKSFGSPEPFFKRVLAAGGKIISWQKEFAASRESFCRGCGNFSKCAGGCPGASCLYNGTLGVDLLCATAYPGNIK